MRRLIRFVTIEAEAIWANNLYGRHGGDFIRTQSRRPLPSTCRNALFGPLYLNRPPRIVFDRAAFDDRVRPFAQGRDVDVDPVVPPVDIVRVVTEGGALFFR